MFFRPKPRVEEFESAAMPHFPDLYRTARLLAQDATEAEDLVQEVYLEAWKSFHRFQAGTNCRAWLFKTFFIACIIFGGVGRRPPRWTHLRAPESRTA